MSYRVRYGPLAIDDLDALRAWIEDRAGFETARDYVERVRYRIDALAEFPHRGQPRGDLRRGMRTLSFEARLLIFYEVAGQVVEILRVVSTRRDLAGLFDA